MLPNPPSSWRNSGDGLLAVRSTILPSFDGRRGSLATTVGTFGLASSSDAPADAWNFQFRERTCRTVIVRADFGRHHPVLANPLPQFANGSARCGPSAGRLEQGERPSGQNQTFGYTERVTWGELIRRLKAAGFVEARTGKGSHRRLINPKTGQIITIAVHTKQEVGTGLAARILKEAGL